MTAKLKSLHLKVTANAGETDHPPIAKTLSPTFHTLASPH